MHELSRISKIIRVNSWILLVSLCVLCFNIHAQEINEDDKSIPFDEDLSVVAAAPASGASSANLKMGIWIETTMNNNFLIRDLAKKEKSGYEYDNSSLYTKANWWFWGDLNPNFHLDAEIGVWEIDHKLYQENSWGANPPDTSWETGLVGLGSIFFAPLSGLNTKTPGFFNKGAITMRTPFVNTRAGYGNLKENSMQGFTGIFEVIHPYRDVDKGFLELSLGKALQKPSEALSLDAVFALSRARASYYGLPYGLYSFVKAGILDKSELALSFASGTSESDLVNYAENNTNAVSFFASYSITDNFKLSGQVLDAFGTDIKEDSLAGALQADLKAGPWSGMVRQAIGGANAVTVWGNDNTAWANGKSSSDRTKMDTSDAYLRDAYVTSLYQKLEYEGFAAGLDTDFTVNSLDKPAEGLWNLRLEPLLDLDLRPVLRTPSTLAAYGIVNIDKIALATDSVQPWSTYFEEAGVELALLDAGPFMKKLLFDYAIIVDYKDWSHAWGYELDKIFHSFMLSYEANAKLSATLGALLRHQEEAEASFVPFGLAAGLAYKTDIKALGSPMVWCHFTYAMDPYEDNNYSLYRYDDQTKDYKIKHRSFKLNNLYDEDAINLSRISVGLIWDL